MIFVTIAALLYFLYDRQKVSIVSKMFYREIVLLDPAIHTSVGFVQPEPVSLNWIIFCTALVRFQARFTEENA